MSLLGMFLSSFNFFPQVASWPVTHSASIHAVRYDYMSPPLMGPVQAASKFLPVSIYLCTLFVLPRPQNFLNGYLLVLGAVGLGWLSGLPIWPDGLATFTHYSYFPALRTS